MEVCHGYLPSPVVADEEQGDNTDDICQNGYGEGQGAGAALASKIKDESQEHRQ